MATTPPRHTKVLKLRILKPANGGSWDELGQILRDVRYRVFRLGNLAVSEAYLNFHLYRTGRSEEFEHAKMSELNARLRKMLSEEDVPDDALARYARKGALPDTVVGALSQNKIRAITQKAKWQQVVRGKTSLPTFRGDAAIPVRCDKADHRRLERAESGDVELDLRICLQPYPRVVLQTGKIGDGARAILKRLLDNTDQSLAGYRQRCFEIKQSARDKKWWLFVTYDFPATPAPRLSADRCVGVDVGFSCPLYVAIGHGHARLGWKQFASLANRIRSLQRQTIARHRDILRGGRSSLSQSTAREGHGRNRRLRPAETLRGRIDRAYTTLNHQLSAAVISFALDHGAGVVQIEDLSGLQEKLSGTFLGQRWRYHQLQQFIQYKADEAGMEVRKVNPRFTSRRCSECGHIHIGFTREFRDAHRENGRGARFECPECRYVADPDYNAARNLATLDIARLIAEQCDAQAIDNAH